MANDFFRHEKELRDRQAEEYDGLLAGYHTSVEDEILARALPSGRRRVLDAGCGTCRFLHLFEKSLSGDSRSLYCGADLSGKSLVVGRRRAGRIASSDRPARFTFTAASVTELPFEDRTFDLVFCSEVYTCLVDEADRLQALREFKRCLVSGGLLFISTHNYSLQDMLFRRPKVYDHFDGRKPNVVRLKRREFLEEVRSVFGGDSVTRCFGGLFFWGLPRVQSVWRFSPGLIRQAERFLGSLPLSHLMGHLLFIEAARKD